MTDRSKLPSGWEWLVIIVGGLFVVYLVAGFALVFVFLVAATSAGYAVATTALLIVFSALVLFGGFLVFRTFIPLFWRSIQLRGEPLNAPSPELNAFRQYLTGPIYADYLNALKETYSEASKWSLPLKLAALFSVAALILVFVAGGLLCGLIALIALLAGWSLGVLERARMRTAGAAYVCSVCHEHFRLPVYRCPGVEGHPCGLPHPRLLPGPYGVLHQRCSCRRAELATLRINGRGHLPAECPSCGASVPGDVGALRNVRIPIAGGPSAGKTSLCVSAVADLAYLDQAGELGAELLGDSAPLFASMASDLAKGGELAPTQRGGLGAGSPALLARIDPSKGNAGLLFVYDVAGELYGDAQALRDQSMFDGFEGAILVVDAFSLNEIREEMGEEFERLKGSVRPTTEPTSAAYQRLVETLRARDAPLSRLPLAVVVTKADALTGTAGIPSGSDVREWLQRFGLANLVLTAEQDFDEVGYFATAARAGANNSSGALAPFAWLLTRQGLELPSVEGAGSATADAGVLLESLPQATARGVIGSRAKDPQDIEVGKGPPASASSSPALAISVCVAIVIGLIYGIDIGSETNGEREHRVRADRATVESWRRDLPGTWRQQRAQGKNGKWEDSGKYSPLSLFGSTLRLKLNRKTGKLVGSFATEGCVARYREGKPVSVSPEKSVRASFIPASLLTKTGVYWLGDWSRPLTVAARMRISGGVKDLQKGGCSYRKDWARTYRDLLVELLSKNQIFLAEDKPSRATALDYYFEKQGAS